LEEKQQSYTLAANTLMKLIKQHLGIIRGHPTLIKTVKKLIEGGKPQHRPNG